MHSLTDLVSNSQQGLIAVIEEKFPTGMRKIPLFLFPANSGKWRALAKRSLRPNHRVKAVLYPDGHCEQITLRKQNHRILMQERAGANRWVAWNG